MLRSIGKQFGESVELVLKKYAASMRRLRCTLLITKIAAIHVVFLVARAPAKESPHSMSQPLFSST